MALLTIFASFTILPLMVPVDFMNVDAELSDSREIVIAGLPDGAIPHSYSHSLNQGAVNAHIECYDETHFVILKKEKIVRRRLDPNQYLISRKLVTDMLDSSNISSSHSVHMIAEDHGKQIREILGFNSLFSGISPPLV